ncbi:transcriptional regulator [Limnoglobus roseus]|uniref:Transcriptional regulator n=1 Tax=Limnoglobus roseus TaxID=2598579 RepID=A0A5C1ABQ3_9BACT|nr:transcriptional regulator [Limnoglobus roseus]QEL14458.1 transcriptional regulator [Limnoglobus roseus]
MAESKPAFDGLDRVMHEKARLGILTCLLKKRDGLTFTDLKDACDLTDGNLSRHLTTLEEAGLVEITKGTNGRRPQTLVCLTNVGAKRFVDYLALLESIVAGALESAEGEPVKPKVRFSTT